MRGFRSLKPKRHFTGRYPPPYPRCPICRSRKDVKSVPSREGGKFAWLCACGNYAEKKEDGFPLQWSQS
jgi:hypothetical protein